MELTASCRPKREGHMIRLSAIFLDPFKTSIIRIPVHVQQGKMKLTQVLCWFFFCVQILVNAVATKSEGK